MTGYLHALLAVIAASLAGCDGRMGDYLAASSIAKHGFARDANWLGEANGQQVRVWGFVDHGNLYGNAGARRILGDWWSGDGPTVATWRFDLMGKSDDDVEHGFPVHVPNDRGRDDLLRAFRADAQAGRPTRVFVQGTLIAFAAPTNMRVLTGLYLEPRSSDDIQLEAGE